MIIYTTKYFTGLDYWEEQLFQILRYHNNTVHIQQSFSADFGVPFHVVKITIEGRYVRTYTGRNLWKRYRRIVIDLRYMYGENLYNYNSKILNQLYAEQPPRDQPML